MNWPAIGDRVYAEIFESSGCIDSNGALLPKRITHRAAKVISWDDGDWGDCIVGLIQLDGIQGGFVQNTEAHASDLLPTGVSIESYGWVRMCVLFGSNVSSEWDNVLKNPPQYSNDWSWYGDATQALMNRARADGWLFYLKGSILDALPSPIVVSEPPALIDIPSRFIDPW